MRGVIVRGFSIGCPCCEAEELFEMGRAGITKAEATMGLRTRGWEQRGKLWICPACIEAERVGLPLTGRGVLVKTPCVNCPSCSTSKAVEMHKAGHTLAEAAAVLYSQKWRQIRGAWTCPACLEARQHQHNEERQYGRNDVDYAKWYGDWHKQLAKTMTRAEIERELGLAVEEGATAAAAHLRALEATTSMTSQSQRRAQSRNVVAAAGDRQIALRAALEIYDLFLEHTREAP